MEWHYVISGTAHGYETTASGVINAVTRAEVFRHAFQEINQDLRKEAISDGETPSDDAEVIVTCWSAGLNEQF